MSARLYVIDENGAMAGPFANETAAVARLARHLLASDTPLAFCVQRMGWVAIVRREVADEIVVAMDALTARQHDVLLEVVAARQIRVTWWRDGRCYRSVATAGPAAELIRSIVGREDVGTIVLGDGLPAISVGDERPDRLDVSVVQL